MFLMKDTTLLAGIDMDIWFCNVVSACTCSIESLESNILWQCGGPDSGQFYELHKQYSPISF